MDTEVAEAGTKVGKALVISLGVRHQNELIYQMGHESAQRHGEAEGIVRQQTQGGAVGEAVSASLVRVGPASSYTSTRRLLRLV